MRKLTTLRRLALTGLLTLGVATSALGLATPGVRACAADAGCWPRPPTVESDARYPTSQFDVTWCNPSAMELLARLELRRNGVDGPEEDLTTHPVNRSDPATPPSECGWAEVGGLQPGALYCVRLEMGSVWWSDWVCAMTQFSMFAPLPAPPPAQAVSGSPRLSIVGDATAQPTLTGNTAYQIHGSGFVAGAVNLRLDGMPLATITTDAAGNFTTPPLVFPNQAGPHELTATRDDPHEPAHRTPVTRRSVTVIAAPS